MENSTVYCDTCLHMYNNTYTGLLTTYILAVLPANGWALWLMMSSSVFLTEKMDLLKFSLLVNDFVIGLALLVVAPGMYRFPQTTQYLWGFSMGPMTMGRPLIQCSICLERYLAVLHPHTFLRYRPLRYRAVVVALACLVVTPLCCVGIALCGTSNEHITVLTNLYGVELLLFLLVDSFCCLCILWALHRPRVGGGGRERDRVKRKAFNTVAAIQISMMCSYTPPVFGVFVNYLMEGKHYCVWYTTGVGCILCTSCLYSLHSLWPDVQACVSRVRTACEPAL